LHLLRKEYDVVICVESINALGALMIKIVSRRKPHVTYFLNDYHPSRFTGLMGKIYYSLDRFCAYRADSNWLMSERLAAEREKWTSPERVRNLFMVSGGIGFPKTAKEPGGLINARSMDCLNIIYAPRSLLYGFDYLKLLCKWVLSEPVITPRIKIFVTGDEPSSEINEVMRIALQKEIISFTGFLSNFALTDLVEKCDLGIAIYPKTNSSAEYGDPEKVRRYLWGGLPVIVVGPRDTFRYVDENRLGLVVDSDLDITFDFIKKICENQSLRRQYSDNVRSYVSMRPLPILSYFSNLRFEQIKDLKHVI